MRMPSFNRFAGPWLAAGALLAVSAGAAYATPITWGTAQTMAGVQDINTSGTILDAVQAENGSSAVTVATTNFNGAPVNINFAGSAYGAITNPGTGPDFTATTPNGYITVNADGSGPTTNFGTFKPSSTNTNYNTVVSTLVYDGNTVNGIGPGGDPGSVVLNKLTIGHRYQVEVWSYFNVPTQNSSTIFSSSGGNSVVLVPSKGQYALGTFTAAASTESFSWGLATPGQNANKFPLLNDVVLSTMTATPEPASIGILAIGGAGLLLLRRKRTH